MSKYTDNEVARFERSKRWKNSKPLSPEEQRQKIEEFKAKQGITKIEDLARSSQPLRQTPETSKEKASVNPISRGVL